MEKYAFKEGHVYSEKGNRIFGLYVWVCPNCKRAAVPENDGKWFACSRCGGELENRHVEFDTPIHSQDELEHWMKKAFLK